MGSVLNGVADVLRLRTPSEIGLRIVHAVAIDVTSYGTNRALSKKRACNERVHAAVDALPIAIKAEPEIAVGVNVPRELTTLSSDAPIVANLIFRERRDRAPLSHDAHLLRDASTSISVISDA